jgi:hypothetical protein
MRFFAVPRSDGQVRDGARVPRRCHCRRFFRCFRVVIPSEATYFVHH